MKTEVRADIIRADRRVKQTFPTLSNRQIDEAFTSCLIKDEAGKKVSKGYRLASAEALDLEGLRRHLEKLRSHRSQDPIQIIHHGPDFLIIDKPAGIPSHPLSLFDTNTVTQWALSNFPEVAKDFPEIQPTVAPHRLDTGTSGIQVVALTKNAFEKWRTRFAKKEVEKHYLAWCVGKPKKTEFEIHCALAHSRGDSTKMVVPSKGEPFKPPVLEAQSFVRVLRQSGDVFLAEIRCLTGVTHQVRVHLASLGFPLVGDSTYGKAHPQFPLHLLRAKRLTMKDESYEVDCSDFDRIF